MNEELLKQLSDSDLEHYANGNMDKMSDEGLAILSGEPRPAPKPGPESNTSGSIIPAIKDISKGLGSGLVEAATFGNKKHAFPNSSPTAENVGNVTGNIATGFLEGLAALKLIPKGISPLKSSLARVLSNSGVSAVDAAARPPTDESSRLENAGVWGAGTAIGSGALESILHSPEVSRFLGRIFGGLSAPEAKAFRNNPEGAKAIASLYENNPEKLSDQMQSLLKGERIYAGYSPGILDALEKRSTGPMKSSKGEIMARHGQIISLPRSTFSGSSPEVMSEVNRILNLNAADPRIETVIKYGPERLNIFREKGPGNPVHRMISDETRFERVIPPRTQSNIILTPEQQSRLMNLTGDDTWKDAAKLNPVEYKKIAEANSNAWNSLRKAQEESVLKSQLDLRKKVAQARQEAPDFVGLPDQSLFIEKVKALPKYNKNINRDINYASRAKNMEPRSLLTGSVGSDAADIRDYLDRYAGSNLQRMADELAAGKKLLTQRGTNQKGLDGFSNYFRRPISSAMIRTPVFSSETKNLIGLPLLQAILRGGQSLPEEWVGDE